MTKELLIDPITIEISPENTTAETVSQRAYRCDAGDKPSIVTQLIKEGDWKQVLVFTRTKHGANRLSKRLDQAGIQSSAIHGNKTQGARTRALDGFKKGQVRVLVATDIAARGLDISQLPHVINFELPNIAEDYVHRIGRTGRAGKEGEAISLVANDERPYFTEIEKLIGKKIPLTDIEGFAPRLWPSRPPTAKEVQKDAAARKAAARKAQGPSKGRQSGSNKSGRKSNSSFDPSAGKSSGGPGGARRGNTRRRNSRGR